MASKKGVGSSKNGRDSESKRLGLKPGAGVPCMNDLLARFSHR